MEKIAKSKDGECLSNKYINVHEKIIWSCKKGHTWKAKPNNILSGHWCPECAGSIKHTIGEIQEVAQSRGGDCLSNEYINAHKKLEWRCKYGHIWETRANNVLSGTWCPECAGNLKLTIEEMHEVAQSRGGECLSCEYINSKTKLQWKCKYGHIWETTADIIMGGSWCPKCAGNIKYGIEDMQKVAQSRGGECLSTEYINSNMKLKWKCELGHVWETTPTIILSGHWCPKCAGNIKYTIEEIQEVAQSRGGECLSSEYINSTTKMQWSCKYGHKWKAISNNVLSGSWCAGLKKNTIEEMEDVAQSREGECLSNEYKNNKTKLKWRCKKGHEWKATPHSILSRRWCRKCYFEEKKEKKLEKIKKIAKEYGGKCLSKNYEKSNVKLQFICKQNHKFSASPYSIKKGSWCPICIDADF